MYSFCILYYIYWTAKSKYSSTECHSKSYFSNRLIHLGFWIRKTFRSQTPVARLKWRFLIFILNSSDTQTRYGMCTHWFKYVLLTGTSGSATVHCFSSGLSRRKTVPKIQVFLYHTDVSECRLLTTPFTIRGNIITKSTIENLDLGPNPNTPQCIVLLPSSWVSFKLNLRYIYPVQITCLWPPYKCMESCGFHTDESKKIY